MDFMGNKNIKFCSTATTNDASMLAYYDIVISVTHDLQRVIANSTANYSPALYALSNAYIGTNILKKGYNFIGRDGWSHYPLIIDKIMYAAMDARIDFEIARRFWQLVGYNIPKDHLNVNILLVE
jgi:hypothetical protein